MFCYGQWQYPNLHIGGAGGPALTVLDENGAALAHLTADADGFAEVSDLPAPDAAYSLDEANSAVRPYAIYSVEAVLDGWQTVVLNGVQVFDAQQTVARLNLLPAGAAPPAPHGQRAARRTPMSSPSRPTRCLPGTAAAARHRRNSYPATSWPVSSCRKKSRCIWGSHPPTSKM